MKEISLLVANIQEEMEVSIFPFFFPYFSSSHCPFLPLSFLTLFLFIFLAVFPPPITCQLFAFHSECQNSTGFIYVLDSKLANRLLPYLYSQDLSSRKGEVRDEIRQPRVFGSCHDFAKPVVSFLPISIPVLLHYGCLMLEGLLHSSSSSLHMCLDVTQPSRSCFTFAICSPIWNRFHAFISDTSRSRICHPI